MHEPADALGRNHVVGTLQHQSPGRNASQISSIIREKSGASERLGNLGIGSAKTVCQFFAELGSFSVAHDDGCHGLGPPEIVAVEEIKQFVNLYLAKSANIAVVVDIARRRPHHDEALEDFRRLLRRERRCECGSGNQAECKCNSFHRSISPEESGESSCPSVVSGLALI